MDYDLLVIGDARDGIDRAISVARSGRRVAILGTPEPVVSLDLMRNALRNLADQNLVTMETWRAEVARLIRRQMFADDFDLRRAGVERIDGRVRFVSSTTVEVSDRNERRMVSGTEIMIACGTRSWSPECLRGDDQFVFRIESLLDLRDIPRSMIVVGAGETGMSAAIMLATLGIEVCVVDEHASLLELCEGFPESLDAAQSLNVAFRLGDEVIGTELRSDSQVAVRLASGRILVADAVLVCVGREGKTRGLDLEVAGVGVDERGRLWCDAAGQTWVSAITAVGDVIGFPRANGRSRVDVDPSESDCNLRDALYLTA